MLKLSCLCGQVRVTVQARPDHVNACNCTLCRKTGAQWAYFHPSQVEVEGETRAYSRADKAEPNACVHFCGACGATTHFTLTPAAIAKFGDTLAGVNMALSDESDLAGVELRFPDGRAWPGEGSFGYVRAAVVIGARASEG